MEIREKGWDRIPAKRNPYLVDYERERGETARFDVSRRKRAAERKRRALRIRLAALFGVSVIAAAGIALAVRAVRTTAHGKLSVPAGGVQYGGQGEDGANPGGSGKPVEGLFVQGLPAEVYAAHPDWEENFLTPNEYSRPGDALEEVKNIFVHYTANPGTSAAQNRSYFERQKDEHRASVSAHFIIGYDGEIIQCVPLDEIAYAVKTRNFDSVSIECCYRAKDGSFTQATYDSLISLLVWLTDAYNLDTEDILRHYDCGGKKCPIYYTEHPDAWKKLKEDVAAKR